MAIASEPLADRSARWASDDGAAEPPEPKHRALTREQAHALRERAPSLSPWRVVATQAALGALVAPLAGWLVGSAGAAWSALYGAGCVVVPGALMARGMTSPSSRMSLGSSAVSFVSWEGVKIAVSVAMLMLAPKIVQALSWPALLVALVLCMQVYWLALLWRPSRSRRPTEA